MPTRITWKNKIQMLFEKENVWNIGMIEVELTIVTHIYTYRLEQVNRLENKRPIKALNAR